MWQAEQIRARLAALYPRTTVAVLGIAAQAGSAASPNGESGARARMVRELEAAIADGRADIAVHALKNLPGTVSAGFMLAGITAREDPRDAFVSRKFASLAALPEGAVIGTSSVRREAQLRERYPALSIRMLRGDVTTRLKFLDSGRCDALIVAAATLCRSGHSACVTAYLEPDESLPAPGQGALAIECRADRPDIAAAMAPLADRATTLATTAERAFTETLCGTGAAPVAAYAEWEEGALWLRGLVAGTRGRGVLRGEKDANVPDRAAAARLGQDLADDLLARGAARLLAP